MTVLARVALIAACLLACCYTPARAEPTPTVEYLMGNNVSLLDWGLYQLEDYVHTLLPAQGIVEGGPTVIVTVEYDWSANRIHIDVLSFHDEVQAGNEERAWLEAAMHRLKWALGVNADTGTDDSGEYGMVQHFFGHRGYVQNDEPDDLGRKIADLIDITFTVPKPGSTGLTPGQFVRCRSALTSSELFYADVEGDEIWR